MDETHLPAEQGTKQTYELIRSAVISAQNRVYAAINTAMV